jgi:methylmalonyl-CoA mutase, N-terminal domain
MTDTIEQEATAILARIDRLGGTLPAIEAGVVQREIQESAYRQQQRVDNGETVVVGVNRFATEESVHAELFTIDPEIERQQIARVQSTRAKRDDAAWKAALDAVRAAARDGSGTSNLVPPIVAAVEARATVGEIADAMRDVFGEYRETSLD